MEKKSKNNIIDRIVTIVLLVIFIPIIILNTMMIIKSYTNPDELPGVFGIRPSIVLSGSMSPVFDTKSLVLIKNTDTENLKEGDIICFLEDGAAVTHRIVEIVNTDGQVSYITKGDANNTEDSTPVSPSQIQGIYIGHIAGLGGVAMFMQTPTGMLVCIGIPVLLYAIVDLLIRKREKKQESSHTAALEAEIAQLRSQNQ